MPDARTRNDTRLYPGCVCELKPPVPGGYTKTWEEMVAWAMGAAASGHSGILVAGIILCSSTAAEMTAYGEAI